MAERKRKVQKKTKKPAVTKKDTSPVVDQYTIADAIMMPAFAYRWVINTALPEELNKLIQKNIIRCSFNLVARTFDIDVAHPLSSEDKMFRTIRLFTKGPFNMNVSMCDGGGNEESFISFMATLDYHDFSLDYGSSEQAIHNLQFVDVNIFG